MFNCAKLLPVGKVRIFAVSILVVIGIILLFKTEVRASEIISNNHSWCSPDRHFRVFKFQLDSYCGNMTVKFKVPSIEDTKREYDMFVCRDLSNVFSFRSGSATGHNIGLPLSEEKHIIDLHNIGNPTTQKVVHPSPEAIEDLEGREHHFPQEMMGSRNVHEANHNAIEFRVLPVDISTVGRFLDDKDRKSAQHCNIKIVGLGTQEAYIFSEGGNNQVKEKDKRFLYLNGKKNQINTNNSLVPQSAGNSL